MRSIGVGIITCNRPDFFRKCYNSVLKTNFDDLVIVNDGASYNIPIETGHLIQHTKNVNVGASKNEAMKYLLDRGCEYIFTLEDDIEIVDSNIFNQYIDAHKKTGIHHYNFGFSQRENLDNNLQPVIKCAVDYNSTKIILTQNILGALTFYTREALQAIGLHDIRFNKGHGDHLELTYRAYKRGYATPFWWFADIDKSWQMIRNLSNMTDDSIVRAENFKEKFNEARNIFKSLHGIDIFDIPEMSENEMKAVLRGLYERRTNNE